MKYPHIKPPKDSPPDFQELFGMFHSSWLSTDPTIDYAIYHFLKITAEDAHLILSGMMFGTKSRLLMNLLGRSNHKNKNAMIESLKKIQAAKRDVFLILI